MNTIRTLTIAALMGLGTMSATAQSTATKGKTAAADSTKKESFGNKVGKFFTQVKDEITGTADRLFSKDAEKLMLIDGKYYMYIYDTNIYHGADAEQLKAVCRRQFAARYPKAEITACAIPQKEWVSEKTEKDNVVTGYDQTLYCYILACDGTDGFINAKFLFHRTKEAGKDYVNDTANWGRWMRTDIIPNDVYDKIRAKDKK